MEEAGVGAERGEAAMTVGAKAAARMVREGMATARETKGKEVKGTVVKEREVVGIAVGMQEVGMHTVGMHTVGIAVGMQEVVEKATVVEGREMAVTATVVAATVAGEKREEDFDRASTQCDPHGCSA